MKQIPLTRGQYAIVDDEDYDRLITFKWHCTHNGYAARMIFEKGQKPIYQRMHRLLINAPEHLYVDHINQNKLDNRKINLRLVTDSQNAQNRAALARSTTGSRGVEYRKKHQTYRAAVTIAGHRIRLGSFKTLEEAARAAAEGRRRYMTHAPECLAAD